MSDLCTFPLIKLFIPRDFFSSFDVLTEDKIPYRLISLLNQANSSRIRANISRIRGSGVFFNRCFLIPLAFILCCRNYTSYDSLVRLYLKVY